MRLSWHILVAILVAVFFAASCGSPQNDANQPSPSSTDNASEPGTTTASATLTGAVSPTGTAVPIRKPIIHDDDGTPDGTIALIYLLQNPDFDVRAITIAEGEAHPAVYAVNMLRLLQRLGRQGIPVAAGRSTPLEGNNAFPDSWRAGSDNGWGVDLPETQEVVQALSGAELMVQVVRESPLPVDIFISGPATNLAEALRIDPSIASNIGEVHIMGGAIYVPGNVGVESGWVRNDVAEWNIWVDPVAAEELLSAGLDVRLSPLDAMYNILWTEADAQAWANTGTPAGVLAAEFMFRWGLPMIPEVGLPDLIAAQLAGDPQLCPEVPLSVGVRTEPGPLQGQTFIRPDQEPNVIVCLTPDAAGMRARMAEVLGMGSSAEIPADTSLWAVGFRDDFSRPSLQPEWWWESENPSHWRILPDGWLEITGEDASLVQGGSQNNTLWTDLPAGDFEVSIHLVADPSADFQQAAIYLYENSDNYVAVLRGYCHPCGVGGNGIFMEYKADGRLEVFSLAAEETDLLLRITRQGDQLSGLYAFEPGQWQVVGILNHQFAFSRVGIGVSNVDNGGIEHDLVGMFDYFEIRGPR